MELSLLLKELTQWKSKCKVDPASEGLTTCSQSLEQWALIYLQPGDWPRTIQPGGDSAELQCSLAGMDDLMKEMVI